MQTIAVISQKGGAGKTTVSIELGFAAHAAGLATAIIDLDPQGTAAKWADRRQADGPSVIGGQASRLGVILDAAKEMPWPRRQSFGRQECLSIYEINDRPRSAGRSPRRGPGNYVFRRNA